jgi:hypothetical protein
LPEATSRAAAHDGAPDGVDQATLPRARQPMVMEQKDEIRERRAAHQFEHVVAAHTEVCRAGIDDGGAPGIHRARIIAGPAADVAGVTVAAP